MAILHVFMLIFGSKSEILHIQRIRVYSESSPIFARATLNVSKRIGLLLLSVAYCLYL